MNCNCCGSKMTSEGFQKNPIRGFKFEIGSCRNEACPDVGKTFSIGPNIPASPEEAAENAAFRAELGKRSEVREQAGTSQVAA